MRGIIYFYSGTGNTGLACEYLAKSLGGRQFELRDVTRSSPPDAEAFDIAGFAASTDFWGIPQRFISFLEGMNLQKGIPAFVLNTYGFISGKTLVDLERLVTSRGAVVIAGHSLHMPESFPPMIALGLGNKKAPGEGELRAFLRFIAELEEKMQALERGEKPVPHHVKLGFLNSLLPRMPRAATRYGMGVKFVDASRCVECGTCERGCPYHAIALSPKPVFDMGKCHGCWRCYNRCPKQAISTRIFRSRPHYPEPSPQLKEKLSVSPQGQSTP